MRRGGEYILLMLGLLTSALVRRTKFLGSTLSNSTDRETEVKLNAVKKKEISHRHLAEIFTYPPFLTKSSRGT